MGTRSTSGHFGEGWAPLCSPTARMTSAPSLLSEEIPPGQAGIFMELLLLYYVPSTQCGLSMAVEPLMLLRSLENSSPTSWHLQNWFHAMTVVEPRVLFFAFSCFKKNMVYAKLAESPSCGVPRAVCGSGRSRPLPCTSASWSNRAGSSGEFYRLQFKLPKCDLFSRWN